MRHLRPLFLSLFGWLGLALGMLPSLSLEAAATQAAPSGAALAPAPLQIVALHPVLAEFAAELGGSAVRVDCLIPAGSDPHAFNPVPTDVRRLAQAELILATGLGLEPWLERLVQNSGSKGRLLEASLWVGRGAPGLQARVQQQDPHWWHSIAASRLVVAGLAETLALARPAAGAEIRARAQLLDTRLAALKAWALTEVGALPESRRIIVTDHDAFAYLADELGFQVRSLNGVSNENEADAKSLAALIRFIREHQIHAIFAESTENPRLLAGMLRESGATLGGVLFADGPAEEGSPAARFEGMYRSNLQTLLQGLR